MFPWPFWKCAEMCTGSVASRAQCGWAVSHSFPVALGSAFPEFTLQPTISFFSHRTDGKNTIQSRTEDTIVWLALLCPDLQVQSYVVCVYSVIALNYSSWSAILKKWKYMLYQLRTQIRIPKCLFSNPAPPRSWETLGSSLASLRYHYDL